MELIDIIGKIARNIGAVDQNEVNSLVEKAKIKTQTFSTEDNNWFSRLYAKFHSSSWSPLMILFLIISVPFIIAILTRKINRLMSPEDTQGAYNDYVNDDE